MDTPPFARVRIMDTPTFDVVSLGKACSILQRHPATIQAAAKELGIVPTVRINHVDHFSAAELEQIQQHLQQGLLRQPKPLI